MRRVRGSRSAAVEPVAAKVPEITALFWVVKVLTTGMGEAAADFLAKENLVLAGTIGLVGFWIAMRMQLRAPRYTATTYWFAVAMVAVFGTMVADGMHIVLALPYPVTTTVSAAALTYVFLRWRRTEGTLSIHSIVTRRREQFYWLAVLATFALGTALGDLTATDVHLGFFWSAVLFAVAIAVPGVAWWRFGMNPIAAFWTAYVLTRPLGASFADWFGKPHSFGHGLGYGDGTVTLVALVVFLALVTWLAVTRSDIQQPQSEPGLLELGR